MNSRPRARLLAPHQRPQMTAKQAFLMASRSGGNPELEDYCVAQWIGDSIPPLNCAEKWGIFYPQFRPHGHPVVVKTIASVDQQQGLWEKIFVGTKMECLVKSLGYQGRFL